MPGVDIQNISFSYDGCSRVLEKIDLHIDEGEFVCILGQSGCGKSTLLRLVAGLEKCSTGKITVDGKAIEGAGLGTSRPAIRYILL